MIEALSSINPELGLELLTHIHTNMALGRPEEPERRPKEARKARQKIAIKNEDAKSTPS